MLEVTRVAWPKLPGLKLLDLNYAFFRSPQIPFGFASVNLKAVGITINLEVDSRADAQPADFSMSDFGTPAELTELVNRNRKRLPTDPNWRVWTWRDNEKTYMAWAEFGGTLQQRAGRDVLLRNLQGTEICVSERSLAEPDRNFLAQGRHWASFSEQRQRVLLADNAQTKELKFRLTDGKELISEVALNTDDEIWLDALRAAIKRNANSTDSTEQWKAFAGYVR